MPKVPRLNGSQAYCPASHGSVMWCQMFVDKISSKCTCTDTSQFRQLDMEELPEGISSGISYTSVCINTPQYLHYLLGKCVAAGVVVKRSILHDISDARGLHASGRVATIVVNCTGLGAATLLGVQDSAVYPARGHVVLLRNDTAGRITFVSGTDDGPEETTYIMQRPAGGGTIVGGCYQANKTAADADPAMGERILERAIKLVPALADGKGRVGLDVIRHGVGLRPVRKGGYRVEREQRQGWTVVHNYGHGVSKRYRNYHTRGRSLTSFLLGCQLPVQLWMCWRGSQVGEGGNEGRQVVKCPNQHVQSLRLGVR
jgi:hypothetical protein